MDEGRYFVYMLTNKYRGILYTGVTNDMSRRWVSSRTRAAGEGSHFFMVGNLCCSGPRKGKLRSHVIQIFRGRLGKAGSCELGIQMI